MKSKVMEMEREKWKVEFSWVKSHAGREGTSWRIGWLRKHLVARTSRSATIKPPKSTVTSELKQQCLEQWQKEWETTTKGAAIKYFFPNTVDRLQLRINPTPNFTAIVTGHGNIRT
jgi:hypothetical protein